MKTFYISTSIPYVNAAPHIGHALEFVQADVAARFARQNKQDVFFLSGTDDNALKNALSAEDAGITPREWVDKHSEIFKKLLISLNISNDDFIRTSLEDRHIKGAQKLWMSCKKEDIYKKKYKGFYCVGCEEFKKESDLVNQECIEHIGRKLETVEEENYFFRLSSYQQKIEDILTNNDLKIIPESRKNEVLSFVRQGLEDFIISRSRSRAKNWGVIVPNDDSQVMYVWFDALSNYINALGFANNLENFKKYWENGEEIIHVIGKGISRFHAIYWPAILLSAGVSLPKKIFVHGYLTIDGVKISKTLGNIVDPFELIKKYGSDSVRYYLLREFTATEDGDYSEEKFIARYNADLANGLGNLVSRVFTLIDKKGKIVSDIDKNIEKEISEKIVSTKNKVDDFTKEFKFSEALSCIWELLSFADKYVNDHKPWAEKDNTKTLINVVTIIDSLAILLAPFLPDSAGKISNSIIYEADGVRVVRGASLFPRI